MRKVLWLLFPALLVMAVAMTASACRQPAAAAPTAPEYVATATVKDLMQSIVDPAADVVWTSVTTVQSAEGTVERAPQTDEEWTKVRHGAVALAEAANLLIVPGRHVGRPGENSETPGVELEPAEMEALIAKDPAAWAARAKGLHEAGVAAMRAAEAKDAQKIFEVGEQIERACENCHAHYWYPNEQIPPVPQTP